VRGGFKLTGRTKDETRRVEDDRSMSKLYLTCSFHCISRLGTMSTTELESDNYDVVVLGTGLAESIAAA
jgi:hypothetical protein